MVDWIGIPYKPCGRAIDGADCWGLVVQFYRRELGISDVPEYSTNYDDPSDTMQAAMAIAMGRADQTWRSKPEPTRRGDVLIFRLMGLSSHAGVYLGEGEFLHCLPHRNSTIEDLDGLSWSRRLIGVYEWAK